MTNNHRYLLIETDSDGEAVSATDVTEEIVFLYAMIEKQEMIIKSYRNEFLPGVFPEEKVQFTH